MRILAALLLSSLLFLPTAAVASPFLDPLDPGVNDPNVRDNLETVDSAPEGVLGLQGEIDGIDPGVQGDPTQPQTMAVEPSPNGCFGKSNNPHISTKGITKGMTKGLAFTKCANWVPELYVKASIWQDHWWGWETMGQVRDNTEQVDFYVAASGLYDGCILNDWRTVGNHYSIEGGKKYSRETINEEPITDCTP